MSRKPSPPDMKREPMSDFALEKGLKDRIALISKARGYDSKNDLLDEIVKHWFKDYDYDGELQRADEAIQRAVDAKKMFIETNHHGKESAIPYAESLCKKFLRGLYPEYSNNKKGFIMREMRPKTGLTFDESLAILNREEEKYMNKFVERMTSRDEDDIKPSVPSSPETVAPPVEVSVPVQTALAQVPEPKDEELES